MSVLLKYLLLIEPDRQRLSRFVLYAIEALGGNLFSATLSLDKCMNVMSEVIHSGPGELETVLLLKDNQVLLELSGTAYVISHLSETPSAENILAISTRLKQESELADPEMLRLRNIRISEDLERAKREAANEMRELEKELEMRRIDLEVAQSKAQKDSLTGLYNHGFYDQRLQESMARCKRQSEALCLLMLDVDKFKLINDTHGHVYGDEYLKRVANSMRHACRVEVDFCCRLGGDEFAIIIFSNAEKSERIAENILEMMEMNVSIGIAEMLPADTPKSFSERCDKALYDAKESGRGKVSISQIRAVG